MYNVVEKKNRLYLYWLLIISFDSGLRSIIITVAEVLWAIYAAARIMAVCVLV